MSMDLVNQALQNAKSSVMFAVMELGGSGNVLQTLQKLHLSGKVFSYGMTQTDAGFSLYKPGQPGQLVPFSALVKQVPPPFDKEFTGAEDRSFTTNSSSSTSTMRTQWFSPARPTWPTATNRRTATTCWPSTIPQSPGSLPPKPSGWWTIITSAPL
jgi:hypothetical protein